MKHVPVLYEQGTCLMAFGKESEWNTAHKKKKYGMWNSAVGMSGLYISDDLGWGGGRSEFKPCQDRMLFPSAGHFICFCSV